jgi:hypothetical protein
LEYLLFIIGNIAILPSVVKEIILPILSLERSLENGKMSRQHWKELAANFIAGHVIKVII